MLPLLIFIVILVRLFIAAAVYQQAAGVHFEGMALLISQLNIFALIIVILCNVSSCAPVNLNVNDIDVSFQNDRYITSAEMGVRCRGWVVNNLHHFPSFSLDQEAHIDVLGSEICEYVSKKEDRVYIPSDFYASLHPLTKRNSLTQAYDNYPTGECQTNSRILITVAPHQFHSTCYWTIIITIPLCRQRLALP